MKVSNIENLTGFDESDAKEILMAIKTTAICKSRLYLDGTPIWLDSVRRLWKMEPHMINPDDPWCSSDYNGYQVFAKVELPYAKPLVFISEGEFWNWCKYGSSEAVVIINISDLFGRWSLEAKLSTDVISVTLNTHELDENTDDNDIMKYVSGILEVVGIPNWRLGWSPEFNRRHGILSVGQMLGII